MRFALAVLLTLLAAAPTAGAQQLRGRLLDLYTSQPIPSAFVTLMSESGEVLATSMSNADGEWILRTPGAGKYLVAARRIGYQPWTDGPITVAANDDMTFAFHLRPLPAMLGTTEVVGRSTRRHLELMGFYERQRSDFGHFMTPEDIAKRGAARVSDLLLGVPGARLISHVEGGAGGRQIQLRAGNQSLQGDCRPRIFVDGAVFARGDARPVRDPSRQMTTEQFVEEEIVRLDRGISIDDIGPASDIAAIEVYRTATQVPVQFGGASIETACGVIVVWTKRGMPKVDP